MKKLSIQEKQNIVGGVSGSYLSGIAKITEAVSGIAFGLFNSYVGYQNVRNASKGSLKSANNNFSWENHNFKGNILESGNKNLVMIDNGINQYSDHLLEFDSMSNNSISSDLDLSNNFF